jgi:hypothetical protein
MAAIHGAGAIIYLSPGTGVAVPVAEQTDYSIELDADIQDTTSLGSSWGSGVRGQNKWTGTLSGNFDTTSDTLWRAGTSETPQRLYVYPQRTVPGSYYYGLCYVKLDNALSGSVSSKATAGVSFTGNGELGRV